MVLSTPWRPSISVSRCPSGTQREPPGGLWRSRIRLVGSNASHRTGHEAALWPGSSPTVLPSPLDLGPARSVVSGGCGPRSPAGDRRSATLAALRSLRTLGRPGGLLESARSTWMNLCAQSVRQAFGAATRGASLEAPSSITRSPPRSRCTRELRRAIRVGSRPGARRLFPSRPGVEPGPLSGVDGRVGELGPGSGCGRDPGRISAKCGLPLSRVLRQCASPRR